MGAWGYRLYSDDVACDVKEYYTKCLHSGLSDIEAEKATIESFSEELSDSDDRDIVIYALADTEWNLGRLSDEVKKRAIMSIDSGNNLKLWENSGDKIFNCRKSVLNKLKDKLLSPMPQKKKISKPRIYKCEWQLGDVFAYKFKSEAIQNYEYFNRYLLIQKVSEGLWYPGHTVPIVFFRLSKDDRLPSIDEINNIKCLKIAIGANTPGVIYDYRGKLINSSKRIIPKSLIYLGNTDVICPEEEFKHQDDYGYFNFSWKGIDNRIIELYEQFNKND